MDRISTEFNTRNKTKNIYCSEGKLALETRTEDKFKVKATPKSHNFLTTMEVLLSTVQLFPLHRSISVQAIKHIPFT